MIEKFENARFVKYMGEFYPITQLIDEKFESARFVEYLDEYYPITQGDHQSITFYGKLIQDKMRYFGDPEVSENELVQTLTNNVNQIIELSEKDAENYLQKLIPRDYTPRPQSKDLPEEAECFDETRFFKYMWENSPIIQGHLRSISFYAKKLLARLESFGNPNTLPNDSTQNESIRLLAESYRYIIIRSGQADTALEKYIKN